MHSGTSPVDHNAKAFPEIFERAKAANIALIADQ